VEKAAGGRARRHLSFFWMLLALAGVVLGLYLDALRGLRVAKRAHAVGVLAPARRWRQWLRRHHDFVAHF
jgi:hypothetical protein